MGKIVVFIDTEYRLYLQGPDITVDNMDSGNEITDLILSGLRAA
jgi:hypothetical protein